MPKKRGQLTGSDLVIRGLATDLGAAQRENAKLREALKELLQKHCLTLKCETGHPCPESISTLQPFFELTR